MAIHGKCSNLGHILIMLVLIACRWPAMIEEDPNKETYYEMGYRDNPIPVSNN